MRNGYLHCVRMLSIKTYYKCSINLTGACSVSISKEVINLALWVTWSLLWCTKAGNILKMSQCYASSYPFPRSPGEHSIMIFSLGHPLVDRVLLSFIVTKLGVGSKVSGKSAIFSSLKKALPPPPLILSLVPIFPKHSIQMMRPGLRCWGEGEEGCETSSPPNVV